MVRSSLTLALLIVMLSTHPAFSLQLPYGGWGNNIDNVFSGVAGGDLLRRTGSAYDDFISAPREAGLPGPREVSNSLFAGGPGPHDWNTSISSTPVNQLFVAFVQLLRADIVDLHKKAQPVEIWPISIPPDDPDFSSETDQLPFLRSAYSSSSGHSPSTPRRQINSATPFLDCGFLYGTNKAVTDTLRAFDGNGQLRSRKSVTSGADLLPIAKADTSLDGTQHNPLQMPASLLRESANRRANQDPAVFGIQTLWLREHNRRAKELKAKDGSMTGTELFERARSWTVAMFQNIVQNEFLPVLGICLDKDVQYNPDLSHRSSSAFALAASQFTQFMTEESVTKASKLTVSRDRSGTDAIVDELHMCNSSFIPSRYESAVGNTDGVDAITYGLLAQPARLPGLHVSKAKRSFAVPEMMIKAAGIQRQDQVALLIQLLRDHGEASYGAYLKLLSNEDSADAAIGAQDVNVDEERVSDLYEGSFNDADLLVGGLMETPPDEDTGDYCVDYNDTNIRLGRPLLGSTFTRIIHQEMLRIVQGDRFWFSNGRGESLTENELADIRVNGTIYNLIVRNTENADTVLLQELYRESSLTNTPNLFMFDLNKGNIQGVSLNKNFNTDECEVDLCDVPEYCKWSLLCTIDKSSNLISMAWSLGIIAAGLLVVLCLSQIIAYKRGTTHFRAKRKRKQATKKKKSMGRQSAARTPGRESRDSAESTGQMDNVFSGLCCSSFGFGWEKTKVKKKVVPQYVLDCLLDIVEKQDLYLDGNDLEYLSRTFIEIRQEEISSRVAGEGETFYSSQDDEAGDISVMKLGVSLRTSRRTSTETLLAASISLTSFSKLLGLNERSDRVVLERMGSVICVTRAGRVYLAEFIEFIALVCAATSQSKIEDTIFRLFDEDGSGEIGIDEFRNTLSHMLTDSTANNAPNRSAGIEKMTAAYVDATPTNETNSPVTLLDKQISTIMELEGNDGAENDMSTYTIGHDSECVNVSMDNETDETFGNGVNHICNGTMHTCNETIKSSNVYMDNCAGTIIGGNERIVGRISHIVDDNVCVDTCNGTNISDTGTTDNGNEDIVDGSATIGYGDIGSNCSESETIVSGNTYVDDCDIGDNGSTASGYGSVCSENKSIGNDGNDGRIKNGDVDISTGGDGGESEDETDKQGGGGTTVAPTPQFATEWDALFELWDDDGSNNVSKDEFIEGLKLSGISPRQLLMPKRGSVIAQWLQSRNKRSSKQENAPTFTAPELLGTRAWIALHRDWIIIWTVLITLTLCASGERAYFYWNQVYLRAYVGIGVAVTRASAQAINLYMGLMILSMCKGTQTALTASKIGHLRAIGQFLLQYRIQIHVRVGYLLMCAAAIHICGHVFNFISISNGSMPLFELIFGHSFGEPHMIGGDTKQYGPVLVPVHRTFGRWIFLTSTGGSGVGLVITMAVMVLFSTARMRKVAYDVFYFTHAAGFCLSFLLLSLHGSSGIIQSPHFWFFAGGPLSLYILEQINSVSMGQWQMSVVTASYSASSGILTLVLKPSAMDRHSYGGTGGVPRRFDFLPGMWAKLKDDRGTWAERIAHPFTIASPPKTSENGESLVFFHIRVLNGFTKRLAILYCGASNDKLPTEDVFVTNTNLNLAEHSRIEKTRSQDFDATVLKPGATMKSGRSRVISVVLAGSNNISDSGEGGRKRKGNSMDSMPGRADGIQRYSALPDLTLYGPFGSPLTDAFGKSKVSVCIAGGIGITPFLSLLWDALVRAQAYREYGVSQRRFCLRKVYLLWLSPNKSTFRSFKDVISEIEDLDIKLGLNLIEIKLVLSGAGVNQDIRRMLNTAVRRTRQRGESPSLNAAAVNRGQRDNTVLDFKKADYVFGSMNQRHMAKYLRGVAVNNSFVSTASVLTCGPAKLVESVAKSVYQINQARDLNGFKMRLHEEAFG